VKKNLLSSAFLLIIMTSGLAMAGTIHLGTAQAATSISGIIFSDTTWTKANSPINITGPTAIAKGVTVTVESGAIVRFNVNTLVVNGTLRAVGTSAEPIILDGGFRPRTTAFGSSPHNGVLEFTNESDGWNAQTGAGCIIENVNVTSLTISIQSVGVKVNNNVFGGSYAEAAVYVNGGDSVISNNKVTGAAIGVEEGSPVINNNSLIGGRIDVVSGSPSVVGNMLYMGYKGISILGGNVRVADNIIANVTTSGFEASGGTVTFVHNLVLYCFSGCFFGYQANVTLRDNTIAFNHIGIQTPPATVALSYNNIENNDQQNFIWSYSSNFDATYNWWGTTDASAISRTIVDYKNDYHLGNVTFIPFLDAPNPRAPLISSFVEPSPSPSPSPTPEPSPSPSPNPEPQQPDNSTSPETPDQPNDHGLPQTWFYEIAIAILVVIVGALIVVIGFILRKKR
jgi:hypothetical protein